MKIIEHIFNTPYTQLTPLDLIIFWSLMALPISIVIALIATLITFIMTKGEMK